MSQLVPIKTSKLSPFEQSRIEMGDLYMRFNNVLGPTAYKGFVGT